MFLADVVVAAVQHQCIEETLIPSQVAVAAAWRCGMREEFPVVLVVPVAQTMDCPH